MDSKIWVCGWLHPGLLVQESGAELRRQDGAFSTDVPPQIHDGMEALVPSAAERAGSADSSQRSPSLRRTQPHSRFAASQGAA